MCILTIYFEYIRDLAQVSILHVCYNNTSAEVRVFTSRELKARNSFQSINVCKIHAMDKFSISLASKLSMDILKVIKWHLYIARLTLPECIYFFNERIKKIPLLMVFLNIY